MSCWGSSVYTSDDVMYCLKEWKKPKHRVDTQSTESNILREANLLRNLNHPNIVKYFGIFEDCERKSTFLVLEYCNGKDLHTLIAQRGSRQYQEATIRFLFRQICNGVLHLHEHGIIHRDLKPLNIMLHRDHKRITMKVVDLGVSRQVSQDTFMINTFYGTPLYLSPEMILGKAYNEKTDMWSLGVILFEMCYLKPPFTGRSLGAVVSSVLNEPITIPNNVNEYSPLLRGCLNQLLQKDFKKRPSIRYLIDNLSDNDCDYESSAAMAMLIDDIDMKFDSKIDTNVPVLDQKHHSNAVRTNIELKVAARVEEIRHLRAINFSTAKDPKYYHESLSEAETGKSTDIRISNADDVSECELSDVAVSRLAAEVRRLRAKLSRFERRKHYFDGLCHASSSVVCVDELKSNIAFLTEIITNGNVEKLQMKRLADLNVLSRQICDIDPEGNQSYESDQPSLTQPAIHVVNNLKSPQSRRRTNSTVLRYSKERDRLLHVIGSSFPEDYEVRSSRGTSRPATSSSSRSSYDSRDRLFVRSFSKI